jgi:ribosome maturation factor RimP
LEVMDLEGLVGPVIEEAGLELVEVTLGRQAKRRVLRVTVDREGGVDLDAIATVSERLSRRLDVEDFDPGPYSLEVTSPGVERPLRRPSDFVRKVGEKVKVRTAEPLQGARSHTGTLSAADEDGVVITTDAGERRVPYGDIASARTVFEWGSRK